MPLRRWLWLSYLRAAIIPLLVIEVSFLLIYWASNALVYRENIATVGTLSRSFLQDVARREANVIGRELAGYSTDAAVLARQSLRALNGNHAPTAAERQRYVTDRDGTIYTRSDNGTTASYYSNVTHPGARQLERMLRLGALDPLMIDLQQSKPDVLSVYFNSRDSYNRIYPYFDAATQYPRGMDITSYNFYYQADAAHDPQRKPVWTDAYVDPAGHGWMVSAIAPVWNGSTLEGVVGIDIGLKAMIDRLMRLDLPWGAYAILVDRNGRIIAMPPAGEGDFGLKELTSHQYSEAIQKDSFKPESFDINRRPDTRTLAAAMARSPQGNAVLTFDGTHLANFVTVPGPGWRLVVIAPEANINAPADALRARLLWVSYAMLAGLLLFYAAFFFVLYRRSREMSGRVARPLQEISGLMKRIGSGEYRQDFRGAAVVELDELGRELVATGSRLGDAYDELVRQEQVVRSALERQQQVNEQQGRLVQIMSHELRTPLAIVDSGAQIIERKAEDMAPADLRRRTERMRGAVRRIAQLLDKLVESLSRDVPGDVAAHPMQETIALGPLVRERAGAAIPAGRLAIDPGEDEVQAWADPRALKGALDAVLDNALRYSGGAGTITVRTRRAGEEALIEVEDSGGGLDEDELAEIGKLFYRGRNAAGSTGAGVSLHLARKHLAETGGRLELANRAGGLCATIAVPLARSGEAE